MTSALVLSAGGLWAAWEVGAWKALREAFRPDLVVGASAGAWNGWAIAGEVPIDELEAQWLDARTGKIMQFGLHATGCLRPEILFEKAKEVYEHSRPKIPFALTMVEVPSLKVHVVEGKNVTWRHLAATAAIPCGFPPIEIDGKRYVDGGFRGALPLWAAEQLGAKRAVALNVLNTPLFRMLHRTLGVKHASSALEVQTIEPSERLGSLRDAVVWSPEHIRRWIELGERDANRVLSSVRM